MRTAPAIIAAASLLLVASAASAQAAMTKAFPPSPPPAALPPPPVPAATPSSPPLPAASPAPPAETAPAPPLATAPAALPPAPPPPTGAAPPGQASPQEHGAYPGYYPPPGYYPGPPPPIGPKRLDYEDGDPIPQGYELKSKSSRGLLIAGGVTFGATWLITAAFATALNEGSRDRGFGPLYIPLIGPFITIGTAESEGAGTYMLVMDGLIQAAGVAMFTAGFFVENKYLERIDASNGIRPEVLVGPRSAALRWKF